MGDVHQQVNNSSIRQESQIKTKGFREGVKIFYRSKSNAATERIGVRPTQLTVKQSALQKFRSSYDLFQNLHEC